MKELFDKFLMYFCFAGIGGIAVFSFVRVTLPTAVRKARAAAVTARKHGVVAVLAVTLFVSGMIVYGSTKNNPSTNDPPARIRMVVRSSSNALVRVEKWWRRGAYDDGQILTFDENWCFPYGTNHLTSVEV